MKTQIYNLVHQPILSLSKLLQHLYPLLYRWVRSKKGCECCFFTWRMFNEKLCDIIRSWLVEVRISGNFA